MLTRFIAVYNTKSIFHILTFRYEIRKGGNCKRAGIIYLSILSTVYRFFVIASVLLFVDIQTTFLKLNRPLISILMFHQIPIITCVTKPTGKPTSPVTLKTILKAIISIIDNQITIRRQKIQL